eukprot:SAG31_NODE_488_length_14964_cov_56.443458_8_plen_246_part_00
MGCVALGCLISSSGGQSTSSARLRRMFASSVSRRISARIFSVISRASRSYFICSARCIWVNFEWKGNANDSRRPAPSSQKRVADVECRRHKTVQMTVVHGRRMKRPKFEALRWTAKCGKGWSGRHSDANDNDGKLQKEKQKKMATEGGGWQSVLASRTSALLASRTAAATRASCSMVCFTFPFGASSPSSVQLLHSNTPRCNRSCESTGNSRVTRVRRRRRRQLWMTGINWDQLGLIGLNWDSSI